MLRQASLSEVKSGKIPRNRSQIVITMRFYPRFLRKELRDDFVSDLAPEKTLLHEFNAASKRIGNHNRAFDEVSYLKRFQLNQRGLDSLQKYSEMSAHKDVYFVCICPPGEMCHREMLMLMGNHLFGAEIGKIHNDYSLFLERLKRGDFEA